MSSGINEYRARVIAAHKRAFDLHTRVAVMFEDASKISRAHPTVVHVVIDMLMIQSMKSHAAVSLIAQHGMMEDTATIARRLMELSVQAVYIGAESEEPERQRRAGKYLAFMWRQLPRKIKHRLPLSIRNQWSSIARKYARFVRKNAKSWGPNWRDMFKEIGQEALYLADYTLLSGIAHGRADNQIFTFSHSTIRVHNDKFASILLQYASRYYLCVAEQWNNLFQLVPKEKFDKLTSDVMAVDAWASN